MRMHTLAVCLATEKPHGSQCVKAADVNCACSLSEEGCCWWELCWGPLATKLQSAHPLWQVLKPRQSAVQPRWASAQRLRLSGGRQSSQCSAHGLTLLPKLMHHAAWLLRGPNDQLGQAHESPCPILPPAAQVLAAHRLALPLLLADAAYRTSTTSILGNRALSPASSRAGWIAQEDQM
jgi:hypothetical protein